MLVPNPKTLVLEDLDVRACSLNTPQKKLGLSASPDHPYAPKGLPRVDTGLPLVVFEHVDCRSIGRFIYMRYRVYIGVVFFLTV